MKRASRYNLVSFHFLIFDQRATEFHYYTIFLLGDVVMRDISCLRGSLRGKGRAASMELVFG